MLFVVFLLIINISRKKPAKITLVYRVLESEIPAPFSCYVFLDFCRVDRAILHQIVGKTWEQECGNLSGDQ